MSVLSGLLDVLPAPGDIQLPGFKEVAGLQLVGYDERQYRYLKEIFDKVPCPAHVQHLKHTLTGCVASVFGASVSLGNPHRTAARGYILPHVGGQQGRGHVLFPWIAPADHLDHPVGAEDILYQGVGYEIVPHCNLCSGDLVVKEYQLHDGRVEYDIAVIGHQDMLTAVLHILQSLDFQRSGCLLQNGAYDSGHYPGLKPVYGVYRADKSSETLFTVLTGAEEKCGKSTQLRSVRHSFQGNRGLLVSIGSDAVVILVHRL